MQPIISIVSKVSNESSQGMLGWQLGKVTFCRLLLMHRTKNGLAVLSATIKLCKECWNWAPTVCVFLTFLWTSSVLTSLVLSEDFSWQTAPAAAPATPAAAPAAEVAATEDGAEEVEASGKWPSLPARVLTVSKLRQFFDVRLRPLFTMRLRLRASSWLRFGIDSCSLCFSIFLRIEKEKVIFSNNPPQWRKKKKKTK